MNALLARSTRASRNSPPGVREFVQHARVTTWLQRLRNRLTPSQYVAWSDLPDEPESPYRARLTVPKEGVPDDVDVDVEAREIVPGEMKIIYEVRCACGKRWFNPRHENVQLCPRCGRAVLLHDPE